MKKIIIKNLEELEKFARQLAAQAKPGEVYGISGELGAGKTTLTQMIGKALGIKEPMTSPTFVLRKEYRIRNQESGIVRLVHIDAYRIEGGSAEDLGQIGESDAVTLVEWPEKLPMITPTRKIIIRIDQDEVRTITVQDSSHAAQLQSAGGSERRTGKRSE